MAKTNPYSFHQNFQKLYKITVYLYWNVCFCSGTISEVVYLEIFVLKTAAKTISGRIFINNVIVTIPSARSALCIPKCPVDEFQYRIHVFRVYIWSCILLDPLMCNESQTGLNASSHRFPLFHTANMVDVRLESLKYFAYAIRKFNPC